MKQAPGSINRDLDEEISKAVEHQYARRLVGKHADASSSPEDANPREHPATTDTPGKRGS